MYIGLKHLHSYFAYLALAMLIFAIVYAIYSRLNSKPFTKGSKTIAMLGLIGTHSQVTFGLILYFLSPLGRSNFSSETMKNSATRLYILEHPIMMILAAVFITIGYSKAKRKDESKTKFNKIILFYTLGLVLILSRIPWNVWM